MSAKNKLRACLGALALILGLSSLATAEPMQEVSVTAFRIPQLQAELIGNSAVLQQSQLELLGATHIQQAIARVPGVNLHHNSGQEYLPAIRSPVLSGAGACGSFLMAEDGIPLRPAGFCNVNELFEAHSEQAARIEVIRGPSAALYGSNALHGVVNVITPEVGTDGDRLSLEYGSHDYYRTRIHTGSDAFSLAFTGTRDGGYRDQTGVDQQKLSLRHRYTAQAFNLSSGMTLINLNQETAGFIEGKNSYRDSRLARTNGNPEAYRDAQALRLWSRFEDNSSQPGWVVTPYVRYSDMAFLQHFLPGTPLEENGQRSAGVQSAWYFGDDSNRIIVGVDLELVHGWLRQSQNLPTPGSPFLQATIPAGKHYDYAVDATQLAPYIHWAWQLDAHWDLSLGLRYEWMQYDYDNRMLTGRSRDDGTTCGFGGCRYSRPADSVDEFSNFSPKLGISYRFSPSARVYLSLARGFRAPQATELYRLQNNQQLADLDSEQLDSLELGLQGASDRLSYEVLVYAMQKRNIIFRDSLLGNISAGRTRHHGLELSLAYALADNLQLGLAATEARHYYDNHEILDGIDIDGNEVDGAPHRFGSLTLNWQPASSYQLELELLHMGGYYTDPENLHAYGGHNLVNLRGSLAVSPQLSVSARLANALDKTYADRADYTGFSGDRYMPGEPRSVFVELDFHW